MAVFDGSVVFTTAGELEVVGAVSELLLVEFDLVVSEAATDFSDCFSLTCEAYLMKKKEYVNFISIQLK